MRFNNDMFFKNFNKEYLVFIDEYYKILSISKIKKDIKTQIKSLQIRENLKHIKERNINYWLIRGWSIEDGEKQIDNINKNRKPPKNNGILTIGYWLSKGFKKEESIKKISEIQRHRALKFAKKRKENPENYKHMLSPFTDEFWIKKGIIDKKEIKRKINSQRKLNIEYWLEKGFNEKESKIKVSQYQKENSEKFIKKWKNKKHTLAYKKQFNTNIEYYLDKGYTPEDSKKLLKERQTTFTLEKCIKKYGEENGKCIYINRQEKWQKSLLENGNLKCGYSKISQELFYFILEKYKIEDRKNIYFATKNKEYFISLKGGSFYLYDFVDIKKKKIIEYNGDKYHANPKLYESNDTPHPYRKNIMSQEIWDKDEKKLKVANKHGFEVLVIWDSEYNKNKEEIIKKSINFLKI